MPVRLVTQAFCLATENLGSTVFLFIHELNLSFVSFIFEKNPTHQAIASLGRACQNSTLDLNGSSVRTSMTTKLSQEPLAEKLKAADQYQVSGSSLPRLCFSFLTLPWLILL